MGRFVSEKGGGFTPAPPGTHVARCIKITDLGTQHGEFQGRATVRNQIMISWELPNAKMPNGQPFSTSAFYTNSLNEKATLRHHLETWRGRKFTVEELQKFDLQSILGKTCLLQVIHNDTGCAKVTAVIALPARTVVPPQVNPSSTFWIETATDAEFEAISDRLKAIIAASDEWKAHTAAVKNAATAQSVSPAAASAALDAAGIEEAGAMPADVDPEHIPF